MKKLLAFALTALLCLPLSGCGSQEARGVTQLRFSDAVSYSAIEALAGQQVSITGYIATLSPLDGSYLYLLNLPYQSCPFCLPNTDQLTNTMAVYAPAGKTFSYTQQAVRVTGTMQVGEFTDDFGYSYNYRIVDAACETVDLSEVSEEYALWQSIASDGVVAEITSMLDYLYFVCTWTQYMGTQTFEDGTSVLWYLYPGDAINVLNDSSAYGYADKSAEGYFENLVKRVRAISDTQLEDLVEVIEDAHELEIYARAQLDAEAYTYDAAQDMYTLDDAQGMAERFDEIYLRYCQWLNKWEV